MNWFKKTKLSEWLHILKAIEHYENLSRDRLDKIREQEKEIKKLKDEIVILDNKCKIKTYKFLIEHTK